MAALVALTLWCVLALSHTDAPVLIELVRVPVSPGVRHIAPAMGGGWYLSDQDLHQVVLRLPDGSDRHSVGGYGWGLSALDNPMGLATDGVRVYVADEGNHRIVEFDRELRPLSAFSTRDTSDDRSRFGRPRDVALSPRGELLVLDGESNEVVCFAAGRRVVFRVGREVPGGTPLKSPSCISLDEAHHLLVGEAGGIRRLDLFGNQLGAMKLDEHAIVKGVAGWGGWIAAVSSDSLYLFDTTGDLFAWSRTTLVPDIPTGELRDVAWNAGTLFVLSEGTLLGFRFDM